MVTTAMSMVLLVGLAVDLSGQVLAKQRAQDIAAEAARAGGQQLQGAAAIRGSAAVLDPHAATAAASTYLAGVPEVTGSSRVSGGDTVITDTQSTYTTKFLSIIGIRQIRRHGARRGRSQPRRQREPTMIRNRLLGLGATLLLLGVLIGLPLTLLAVGANPLPSSLPSLERVRAALTSPDDGTLMLAGITVIAWVAWAVLAVSILLELLGRLRGLRAPHLPGLSLPQGAARQLVTAAALLFVVGSTGATASGAAQAVSATAGPVTATVSASAPVAAAKAAAPAHGTSARRERATALHGPGRGLPLRGRQEQARGR